MTTSVTLERTVDSANGAVQEFVQFYESYYAHTVKENGRTVVTTVTFEYAGLTGQELFKNYMDQGFIISGVTNDK